MLETSVGPIHKGGGPVHLYTWMFVPELTVDAPPPPFSVCTGPLTLRPFPGLLGLHLKTHIGTYVLPTVPSSLKDLSALQEELYKDRYSCVCVYMRGRPSSYDWLLLIGG